MGLDQLRRTAIHEAGHAVVGYLKLRGERKLLKVSIIPEEDTVGQVLWSGWPEGFDPFESDKDEVKDKLMSDFLCILAGMAAEKIAYGMFPEWGYGSDLNHAMEIADAYSAGPEESNQLVELGLEQTEKMLIEYWPAVEALAEHLLEHECIEGEEAEQLICSALFKC